MQSDNNRLSKDEQATLEHMQNFLQQAYLTAQKGIISQTGGHSAEFRAEMRRRAISAAAGYATITDVLSRNRGP